VVASCLPLSFRVAGGPWFNVGIADVLEHRLELDLREGTLIGQQYPGLKIGRRAPASTAAALTASTLVRVWRRPRRSRGSGIIPAVAAGQGGRPRRVGGHGGSG
jgi:hypothetical protein